jgi:hypothetical protein
MCAMLKKETECVSARQIKQTTNKRGGGHRRPAQPRHKQLQPGMDFRGVS